MPGSVEPPGDDLAEAIEAQRHKSPTITSTDCPPHKLEETTKAHKYLSDEDPCNHFPFGDLPAELVLRINDFLPNVARLSLAAACKNFRKLIPPPAGLVDAWPKDPREALARLLQKEKKQRADIASRREFVKYVKRDAFNRAVRFERSGVNDTLKACCRCFKTHPTKAFSNAQLALPPERRQCLGQEVALQLCKHKSLKMDFPEHEDKLIQCGESDCQSYSSWCRRSLFNASDRGAVSIHSSRPVLQLENGKFYLGNDIRTQLAQKRPEICPHTVLSPHHFAGIENLEITSEVRMHRTSLWQHTERCTNPNCKTEFRLLLTSRICVYVERIVGTLEDATDPAWTSQCGLKV
ncbi:hypothetical protein IWZ00DRAFT_30049 [Phyllosticta capitalensis]|uniref:F-box domain-containing protein n=1 Tax=Phyllosticta capitalensis TaxID=121624 RepID=A0ABR1Z3R0_9PEZI